MRSKLHTICPVYDQAELPTLDQSRYTALTRAELHGAEHHTDAMLCLQLSAENATCTISVSILQGSKQRYLSSQPVCVAYAINILHPLTGVASEICLEIAEVLSLGGPLIYHGFNSMSIQVMSVFPALDGFHHSLGSLSST